MYIKLNKALAMCLYGNNFNYYVAVRSINQTILVANILCHIYLCERTKVLASDSQFLLYFTYASYE